ncbi:MAG: DUF4214 domain-containing protein [Acidimicrobiia bacterium]|nr:DUF4214 domain-containing protein [Acidimicrobiia bacterium]
MTSHPSSTTADPDPSLLTRRLFLQAVAAGVTVSALPAWLAEPAAAAAPLGPGEGTLVLLTMAGGNDGLNTFIPTTDGAYHDARRELAIGPHQAIALTSNRGLHPNLPYLKQHWDEGNLAIIDGVGQDGLTMSHFDSMARVMMMAGTSAAMGTGWLGRFLDGLGRDPFNGVSLGSSIPLVVKGRGEKAIALPEYRGNIFDVTDSPTKARQYRALRELGRYPTGLGPLADSITQAGLRAVDLAGTVRPLVEERTEEARVVTRLRLAARLINANLGVRVISIVFGDFDTHAGQRSMHNERMTELNAGLKAFFETLKPDFLTRTLVVGTSEFGRRVAYNGSGTDHGQANSLFAIGRQVNGGFYGQMPSLTRLTEFGNLRPTVDFSQFYGNLVSTWLGADTAEILGRDHGDIGFLNRPGQAVPGKAGPVNVGANTKVQKRAQVARLYLAYFGADPDDQGMEHWSSMLISGARSLQSISDGMAQSPQFTNRYGNLTNAEFVKLIYRNVLNRAADSAGLKHWTTVLDSGTSRGAVMVNFSESAEFQEKVADRVWRIELVGPIGRLYRAYFLRRPDDRGLAYWINSDLSLSRISDAFAQSREFLNRYGTVTNAQFITLVYRNVLGRRPEPKGFDYWLRLANRGNARGKIMLGFSNSTEFIRKVEALTP